MKNLLLVFLTSLSGFAFAQTFGVKGAAKTQQNEAASFATVAMHKAQDSTLVKADIADENGGFKFNNLNKGKYFIKISAVGFQPFASPVFEIIDADIDFKPFVLLAETQQLKEVKVVASKPMIEVKDDRVVFNV